MNNLRNCQLLLTVVMFSLVPCAIGQTDLQPLQQLQAGRNARAVVAERSAALSIAPKDIEKLRIRPGYLLSLNVLNDPDFTGSYRVNEHGDIVVPFLGVLPVSGKTETEVREQIRKKLADDRLLINPQVQFSIQEYIPEDVTILGEVNAPGSYPLLAPHDLSSVLTLAGGMSMLAGNRILITSPSANPQSRLVHASRATPVSELSKEMINPGDSIQVERAGIIYVLGSVNHPGGFLMQDFGKLTVAEALSLASGTNATASSRVVFIVRKKQDGTVQQIEVPFGKVSRGKAPDIALLDSDIVYVPNSTFKAIMVNSQLILSTAASALIYTYAR